MVKQVKNNLLIRDPPKNSILDTKHGNQAAHEGGSLIGPNARVCNVSLSARAWEGAQTPDTKRTTGKIKKQLYLFRSLNRAAWEI